MYVKSLPLDLVPSVTGFACAASLVPHVRQVASVVELARAAVRKCFEPHPRQLGFVTVVCCDSTLVASCGALLELPGPYTAFVEG